ncbi:MAG: NADH-quinone oxidoreductase subunit C [Betaproteobacteria bacterium]|nr:NADH-quinone oxidoreductase subunit C [Betaproteobacteria bacterium]
MSAKLEKLSQNLQKHLGERIASLKTALNEITVEVRLADYLDAMRLLRDTPELGFEELLDLCGVDYSTHSSKKPENAGEGSRFAAVSHLLSISNNWRVRVRVFAENDNFPSVPSVTDLWKSAVWYEREAFDLFGIVFPGHDDLRRILTDYGFIGHPFRKDFPVSGHVEMRYDPDQRRVVYQPVTIELRENTLRTVREENYSKH